MENQCKLLDFKLLVSNENETCDGLLEVYKKIEDLQQQISQYQSTIEMVEESMTLHLSKSPDDEIKMMETFKPRIDFYFGKVKTKVSN